MTNLKLIDIMKSLRDPSSYFITMNKDTYENNVDYEVILYSEFFRLRLFVDNKLEDGVMIVKSKDGVESRRYIYGKMEAKG